MYSLISNFELKELVGYMPAIVVPTNIPVIIIKNKKLKSQTFYRKM